MELRLLEEADKLIYRKAMLDMLTSLDKEFVPPLSQRSSTTQNSLLPVGKECGSVCDYYTEMSRQQILCALEGGELLGFVSYRKNYTCEVISDSELPNIYISTLLIAPSARGRGLTARMYSYLFDELYPDCRVFTRTWSTNTAHTKILSRFGFFEIERRIDDRGEGIDTVYYKKEKSRAVVGSVL